MSEHEDLITATSGPQMLYFSAAWCGPCKVFKPIMAKTAIDRANDVSVVFIDVDESPKLSAQYNIMTVPTVVTLVDGEETSRFSGVRTPDYVNNHIDSLAN